MLTLRLNFETFLIHDGPILMLNFQNSFTPSYIFRIKRKFLLGDQALFFKLSLILDRLALALETKIRYLYQDFAAFLTFTHLQTTFKISLKKRFFLLKFHNHCLPSFHDPQMNAFRLRPAHRKHSKKHLFFVA
jgi:hypothetical protein